MYGKLLTHRKKCFYVNCLGNDATKTILIVLQHCVILPVALAIVQDQTNVPVIEDSTGLVVLYVICKSNFTCTLHNVKSLEFVVFNIC